MDGASTSDAPARACNGLEALFAACDVRFGCGVLLQHPRACGDVERACSRALAGHASGWLAVGEAAAGALGGGDATTVLHVVGASADACRIEHVVRPREVHGGFALRWLLDACLGDVRGGTGGHAGPRSSCA